MTGGRRVDRRQFLAGGAGLFLSATKAIRAESGWNPPEFLVPLPIPPVLAPVRSDGNTDYYEIVQRESWVEIVPGTRTRV
ncbi:MAG TPA: multicopper oxidase family protein, partial [Vicinamibacteria bacterium]